MPRMSQNIECYIDGYNEINAYISKGFFQGQSTIFYLKDSRGNLISLIQKDKIDRNSHIQYVLHSNIPLTIGEKYTFYEEHCQPVPASYSHVTKNERFAREYEYDGDDLGITYSPEKTTFKVWSPTANSIKVVLKKEDGDETISMKRQEKGVWVAEVEQDLLHTPYTYLVDVNGTLNETNDPYNPFLGANTLVSFVDDISLVDMPEKVPVKPLEQPVDAIIYEANVRDMTSQIGLDVKNPRKFAGFIEENEQTKEKKTGFSYLKDLGITHVQLMPVLDFGSTMEDYPNLFYNWGYDPAHYRGLEGSYSLNPSDPRSRIVEFAQLVQALHKEGIKVILDVVFNHVYNREAFSLNRLVPDYYFLINSQGDYSNGSFCGNDIDSRPIMAKKYLIDTCKMLIDLYDIDGLRFDLMGVLDIGLLNEIEKETHKLKEDFLIYGEGWNMPSFVPEDIRASINNMAKMPRVGHFSDRFRETVRGSNGDLAQQGYGSGNLSRTEDARQVMTASIFEGKFDTPQKVINYIECHDNHTMWDKIAVCCSGQDENTRKKKLILSTAMVLMAQGVPFIHAGQEFARTKQGLGNTYNSSDIYNLVDYVRKDENQDMVDQFKKLVKIRKEHPSLRLSTADEVRQNASTETINGEVLVYKTFKGNDRVTAFFNPTERYFDYHLGMDQKVEFDSGNTNPERTEQVVIAPHATVILSNA